MTKKQLIEIIRKGIIEGAKDTRHNYPDLCEDLELKTYKDLITESYEVDADEYDNIHWNLGYISALKNTYRHLTGKDFEI